MMSPHAAPCRFDHFTRVCRPASLLLVAAITVTLLLGCQAPAPAAAPPQPTPTVSIPPSVTVPPPDYWPTNGWKTSTPEQQGMDSAKLAALLDAIEQRDLTFHSVLVIRNGYLVAEAYFSPYDATVKQAIASTTKSVTGMLTGVAIAQGKIKDIHQTVLSFFPGKTVANLDDNKRKITLEHLLTLTTGLDCNDGAGTRDRMYASPDWVQFTLDLPMTSPPGTQASYCSPAVQVLTAILQGAVGKSEREYGNEMLFAPLGIPPATEAEFPADPQGVSLGFGGLTMTPRDMAKLGFLYLHDGSWDEKQVVPADWVHQSIALHVAKADFGRSYGYLIWVYPQGYQSMMGLGGQHIHMIRAKNVVVVFTAAINTDTENKEAIKLLDEFVVPAATSDKPLPENPVAFAELQKQIAYATAPVRPVQPLPVVGSLHSGTVYTLDENPNGWQSFSIDFPAGSDAATLTVGFPAGSDAAKATGGKVTAQVGLDNVYRTTDLGPAGITRLRGQWEDGVTFAIQASTPGEWSDIRYHVVFMDPLRIEVTDSVTGGNYTITGHATP